MNRALLVGQNLVDPAAYGGWNGVLACCENDCVGHQQLALRGGCETHVLQTDINRSTTTVTKDAWRKMMDLLAAASAPGELLYYAHSGHGSSDTFGQGLVMADGIVYEDEFRARLARFHPESRVFCFLDTCHSGGIGIAGGRSFMAAPPKPKFCDAPTVPARDAASEAFATGERLGIPCSVAILSAALTDEVAYDGDTNRDFGRATGAWLSSFRLGLDDAVGSFVRARELVHQQTLNLRVIGGGAPGWLNEPLFH